MNARFVRFLCGGELSDIHKDNTLGPVFLLSIFRNLSVK